MHFELGIDLARKTAWHLSHNLPDARHFLQVKLSCGVRPPSVRTGVGYVSNLYFHKEAHETTHNQCDRGLEMKTQGEIEAAVCEGFSRFEQEYMGRGPKDVHAYLIGDLLVVRLQGVLTAAEQHLVKTLPPEKGRDLLKQVRTQLIETARPVLEAMIQSITGLKPISLHHDISTITGEEIVILTLPELPPLRASKKK